MPYLARAVAEQPGEARKLGRAMSEAIDALVGGADAEPVEVRQ